jgi:hypothetical protein
MNKQHHGLAKSPISLFKSEAFKRFGRKLQLNLNHSYVFAYQADVNSDLPAFAKIADPTVNCALNRCNRFWESLELKRIEESDTEEIEEIAEIDPWGEKKGEIIERLRKKWLCFVGKNKGRVIVYSWNISSTLFYETLWKRTFALDSNEAYTYRSFCVPEFRGRGVLPWLSNSIMIYLRRQSGIKNYFGYVRTDNLAQIRTLTQMGWSKVGRLGFIDLLSYRFHYLIGRNAFPHTKKRLFIERKKDK